MAVLWTFENQEKMAPFLKILEEEELTYELLGAGDQKKSERGLAVAVADGDLEDAKRLLLRYKRQRTNRNRK